MRTLFLRCVPRFAIFAARRRLVMSEGDVMSLAPNFVQFSNTKHVKRSASIQSELLQTVLDATGSLGNL